MSGGKCIACGKPVVTENQPGGHGGKRVRAWCRRCLYLISHFGCVDVFDAPTYQEARNCGGYRMDPLKS